MIGPRRKVSQDRPGIAGRAGDEDYLGRAGVLVEVDGAEQLSLRFVAAGDIGGAIVMTGADSSGKRSPGRPSARVRRKYIDNNV